MLLTPKGEVEVADTIYRITPNGTYYFPKSKIGEFERIYKTDSLGYSSGSDLYTLSKDIYRYDTFKELPTEEWVEVDAPIPGLNDDSEELPLAPANSRAISEPNYNSFPVFSASRHTFFGKMWQGLFGKDKYYDVKFSSKRKVRGRFYAYKYVF